MPEDLQLSRADLPALKSADRARVFAVLRSFDDTGLNEEQFMRRALALLNAARVPGLAEALAADDLGLALSAVGATCARSRDTAKPELSDSVRAMADNVLAHRFDFYGEMHQLPPQIDWNFNPGTAHWAHDLNRFSYLSPLVQTYCATGDTRYSRKAVELILDWIAKCDFAASFEMKPYAFSSYLNLALHAVHWSRAVRQLAAHEQVTPRDLLRILKSLHDHLAYLEIVTHGHAGNWPTIGVMGMLGTMEHLPVLRDIERWVGYGQRSVAAQIAEQVLPDGVQDELTPHYHFVVVSNLVTIRRSLRALGHDLDAQTMGRLRQMIHYAQQTLTPDGRKQVAFNDSDPGAAPDLAAMLKPEGLGDLLRSPDQLGPEVFPYAGVAFLRQRQDHGDLYLAFDAGPFGRSHQHEDKLGFWLFAYSRSFLIDPGRHLYDHSEASFYDYLCGTGAHSTIMVDGQGQNSRRRRDSWIAKAPLDLGWSEDANEIRASGVYDLGYGPDGAPQVVHRRTVVFVNQRCWVLFDELTGDGDHTIESRFQFAPGRLRLDAARAVTDFPDANLMLWPIASAPAMKARVEEGQTDPRGGWYSDRYGIIEPAPALSLALSGTLPIRIATLLLPYRGTQMPDADFTFDGSDAVVRLPEMGRVRVTIRGGRRAGRPSVPVHVSPASTDLRPHTPRLRLSNRR